MSVASSRESALQAYRTAAESILGLIRGERSATRTAATRRQRAEGKRDRALAMLAALGDPQQRYPIVHVTGTSGKGSTAAAIAAILTASGYRVGLRTSPYLQVATEKLQVGHALIDAASFARLSTEMLDLGQRLFPGSVPGKSLGYAEVWSALAFQWFAESHVDIAVIEVGAGGRFDTTNVFDPVVSVITSVGLDHVISLGPTIADIAWHKAGIIKPGSVAIVGDLAPEALAIVREEARVTGAPLVFAHEQPGQGPWQTGMRGAFQQVNSRIAVSAVRALRDRGFAVTESAIAAGLAEARLPGRVERMPGTGSVDVWIDGAHNADKIAALAREIPILSPRGSRPVVVLGILGTKDGDAIARGLSAVASTIVATRPKVLGKRLRDASELARTVKESGFAGRIIVEPEPDVAVTRAMHLACAEGSSALVTGSMYLAGQARRRWFADDDIVLQQTPWPACTGSAGSDVP